MNVVLVSMVFPHPRPGFWPGIERQIGDLAASLVQAGATVTVVTSFRNGGADAEEYRGIRIVRLHDPSERLGRAGALLSLHVRGFGRAVAARGDMFRDADVVESFVPLPDIAAPDCGPPRLFSFFAHRDRPARWRDYLHMPAYYRMERSFFQKVDGVIVASDASRKVLVDDYAVEPARIHTIPLGVAPVFLSVQRAGLAAAHPGPARLLYVGPLIKRKDVATLVRALPPLRKAGIACELIIAGEGPEREPLRELAASLGVEHQVTFEGFVPDARLPQLYHGADVFVFPSLKEGFGQVLLEAMASGLPVVSSERAPMTEVLGDAGLYFEPGDAAGLSEKIATVLGDTSLREKLAAAGSRRVRERFTWPRVAEATLALFAGKAAA